MGGQADTCYIITKNCNIVVSVKIIRR